MTNKLMAANGSTVVKAVCAIAFCMFCFAWLFFFQADLLTVAQHELSHGVTHYNGTVGAIVITAVLLLLQRWVQLCFRKVAAGYALSFFPSLLALALLTDYHPGGGGQTYLAVWSWLAPLLLAVWGGLLAVLRNMGTSNAAVDGYSIGRQLWSNLLLLCLQFLFVALAANGNDVTHYRARMETLMASRDFEKALTVGERSAATDQHLTMLRAYALSRRGEMGEMLFRYPVKGTSSTLLPAEGGGQLLLYPADSVWRHLGARPLGKMNTKTYLKALQACGRATRAVADYRLCGCLVDKDLDTFVKLLPRYYTVNDSLPRHYREALVLYTHQRAHPALVYHDSVMDTDFADFQKLEDSYPEGNARKLAVYEQYFGTYWWYYLYE